MLIRFDTQQDVVEALTLASLMPGLLDEATRNVAPIAQGLMTSDAMAEAMGKFMAENENDPGLPIFEAMVETTAIFVGAIGFATHNDEGKALASANEFIDSAEFFRMVHNED